MSNRTLLLFSGIILACVLALFAVNFSRLFSYERQGKFIDPGYVSGIEVFHKKLPYPLNFDQQNDFINLINISNKVKKSLYSDRKDDTPFEKIVIYLFDKAPVEITPAAITKNQNIVFQAVEWNPDGFILDMSQGKLLNLINTTYDD